MKTTVLSTVLAVLVACLATCFAEDGAKDRPELRDRTNIDDLLDLLDPKKVAELKSKYDEQGVRLYSVEAVGKLKDKEALPFLLNALDDKHPQVRLWAVLALKGYGEKAAFKKVVIKCLTEKLADTAEVNCYGTCRSKSMPNVQLGVRLRVCVCDAAIEVLNSLIPERKAEGKFSGIFYPSEEKKKSKFFRFYGVNLPEKPDTGHWGNPEKRKKAVMELQKWWDKTKNKLDMVRPTTNAPGEPSGG
jgi:hypothetical protein